MILPLNPKWFKWEERWYPQVSQLDDLTLGKLMRCIVERLHDGTVSKKSVAEISGILPDNVFRLYMQAEFNIILAATACNKQSEGGRKGGLASHGKSAETTGRDEL